MCLGGGSLHPLRWFRLRGRVGGMAGAEDAPWRPESCRLDSRLGERGGRDNIIHSGKGVPKLFCTYETRKLFPPSSLAMWLHRFPSNHRRMLKVKVTQGFRFKSQSRRPVQVKT